MQAKVNLVKGIAQKELPDLLIESGEGIVALDQKGLVLKINPTAETILGWGADEILGKDFFALSQLLLPENMTPGTGSTCPALNTVKCPHLNASARITRKDGSEALITFMLTSLLDGDSVTGKLFIFSDDTDSAALPTSQEVIDAAASIIVKLNASGNVTYANQHGHWLFGEVSPDTYLPISIKTLLLEAPNQLDQQTLT